MGFEASPHTYIIVVLQLCSNNSMFPLELCTYGPATCRMITRIMSLRCGAYKTYMHHELVSLCDTQDLERLYKTGI